MPRSACEFGKFSLDVAEHRLYRDGQPVPLTPRVFDLLRVLVESAGHLVEKERLLTEVWHDAFVEESNLTRAISVLRKALGETPTEQYIETVPKRGYRFVAPVGPQVLRPDERPNAKTAFRSRRARVLAGIAAAGVLMVGAFAFFGRSAPGAPTAAAGAPLHRQLTVSGRVRTPTLSPNGSRVAYFSDEPPYRKVMVQDLAGGSPVEVFRAPETGWPRWSPDNSELMFWARGEGTDGLYLVRPPEGQARKIAPGGLFASCWSPDGSTIALATFVKPAIWFLNKAGERQRSISLKGTREWIWDLDWSPAHGGLLFVADDDQRRATVWAIRPDGSGQTKLLTAATEILAARWAPGGEAVYYFTRVNQTVSLYKVALDLSRNAVNGEPIVLLSGLETDQGFGVSADGSRLVYARAPYYSNLWLAEAEGGKVVRRTQLTRATSVIERPRLSPDGKTILFTMGYESRANLYTIPATGGIPRQLTFLNAFSAGGVWSPDGRSVAFGSNEGGQARVWIVNADGSSPRPLPTGDMSESYELLWSPGVRLLYQRTDNMNYYVFDPRTRQQKLLLEDRPFRWFGYATYSPDGSQIALGWNGPPAPGIWLIDSEGRRETLISKRARDSAPFPIGWSPDGKAVYAVDGKNGAYRGILVPFELTTTAARILRVPVSGAPAEPIVSLPFEEIGSVTVFPDGRRFLCTVYSSQSDVWIVENFDVPAASKNPRRSVAVQKGPPGVHESETAGGQAGAAHNRSKASVRLRAIASADWFSIW